MLIRALAPTEGLAAMRRRRGLADERLLCSGPGRLCEALGITGKHDGLALDRPPFELHARTKDAEVAVGPRIGITKAVDHPWRYGLKGSRFVSKPFKMSVISDDELAAGRGRERARDPTGRELELEHHRIVVAAQISVLAVGREAEAHG